MRVRGCLAAALVAVLLLGAATGAVLATDSTQDESGLIIESEGTTNSLGPDNVTADGYIETGLDVGSAVAADAQELHARHDELTFEEQFAAASDSTERREIVDDTVREIEREIRDLEARQANLHTAYGAGQLETTALVRALLRLDAAAERQQQRTDRLVRTVDTSPDMSLTSDTQNRIDAITSNPVLRTAPVEQRMESAALGTGEPVTVYGQSDGDALVLATVSGNTHLRQATVLSEREGSGIDRIGTADQGWFDATNERVAVLYPWAWENLEGGGGDILRGLPYYFVDIQHPHGTLELFFDGTTENVFREHQMNDARAIPTTETATNTANGLAVEVNQTYPTGPMRVAVTDTENDLPVDASVSVDGHHIGVTGGSGQLWTVQPGGEFTVTVTTADGETATVTVTEETATDNGAEETATDNGAEEISADDGTEEALSGPSRVGS